MVFAIQKSSQHNQFKLFLNAIFEIINSTITRFLGIFCPIKRMRETLAAPLTVMVTVTEASPGGMLPPASAASTVKVYARSDSPRAS